MKHEVNNKYSKCLKRSILISCLVFALLSQAYAEHTATIVDTQGSTVNLTSVVTSGITLNIGDSQQVIPLGSIRKISINNHGSSFVITLTSGEEVSGSSDSTIQGTWELGEYKISLSKVRSLTIHGTVADLAWDKPEGYVAEVVDTKGSIIEVYGLSFKYRYSYTMANCIGYCGSSSTTTLDALPINQDCGASIVPLEKIASISDISQSFATITFVDGKTIKSKFGYFGGESLDDIKGATKLGEYNLSLGDASRIVFRHDKDIPSLPKYDWGTSEHNLALTITCKNGATRSLVHAAIYDPRSSGKVYRGSNDIKIQIGEANNKIELNKTSKIVISSQEKRRYPILLTTKTGATVSAILVDSRYIGGYTKDGWFYYVKMKDLQEISTE